MKFKAVISDKDGFLEHHGVKGQKWGVWNDETKRKYGMLKTSAGGGGGSDDDEEEAQGGGVEDAIKEVNKYNPNTEEGRENQEKLKQNLFEMGIDAAQDVINEHLLDIQTGNISDGEARIIAIVNAASHYTTGEPAIHNPKGAPAAFQEKTPQSPGDIVMVGDWGDKDRAVEKYVKERD